MGEFSFDILGKSELGATKQQAYEETIAESRGRFISQVVDRPAHSHVGRRPLLLQPFRAMVEDGDGGRAWSLDGVMAAEDAVGGSTGEKPPWHICEVEM